MTNLYDPARKGVRACVVWFTGIPGSGKTTLAAGLREELVKRGAEVEHLDGDEVRKAFPGTDFSKEGRNEHIRRAGFAASCLESHGIFVVASFVSPYRESREFVRKLCRNFIEVYVHAPVDVCEKRDPKGLYKKARSGEIKDFTGVQDPYEEPASPEIEIDTAALGTEEAVKKILTAVEPFLK
jgi:adenylylsulfate kinase